MRATKLFVLALIPGMLAFTSTDFPTIVKKKELYAKNDFRGKEFSKFTFGQALSGKIPTKEDLKDKVLLIDFWATWCPPCREVIPEMNEWAKKFEKDLVIVGVSDEAAAKVQEFMKKTPINYTSTVDKENTMSKLIGINGIPHVLVISKDGIVRYQGFPLQTEDKLTTEKLKQIIDANRALPSRD